MRAFVLSQTHRPLSTGEAKQKARQAEQEARLAAEEAGESPLEPPNVEVLSLDASLSGPIASLQEGVISGMEVQNTNGALLTSRPDHLKFTYEVQVDGEDPVKKVGKRGGAWASDTEGEVEGGVRQAASQHKSQGKADGPGVTVVLFICLSLFLFCRV